MARAAVALAGALLLLLVAGSAVDAQQEAGSSATGSAGKFGFLRTCHTVHLRACLACAPQGRVGGKGWWQGHATGTLPNFESASGQTPWPALGASPMPCPPHACRQHNSRHTRSSSSTPS